MLHHACLQYSTWWKSTIFQNYLVNIPRLSTIPGERVLYTKITWLLYHGCLQYLVKEYYIPKFPGYYTTSAYNTIPGERVLYTKITWLYFPRLSTIPGQALQYARHSITMQALCRWIESPNVWQTMLICYHKQYVLHGYHLKVIIIRNSYVASTIHVFCIGNV